MSRLPETSGKVLVYPGIVNRSTGSAFVFQSVNLEWDTDDTILVRIQPVIYNQQIVLHFEYPESI